VSSRYGGLLLPLKEVSKEAEREGQREGLAAVERKKLRGIIDRQGSMRADQNPTHPLVFFDLFLSLSLSFSLTLFLSPRETGTPTSRARL